MLDQDICPLGRNGAAPLGTLRPAGAIPVGAIPSSEGGSCRKLLTGPDAGAKRAWMGLFLLHHSCGQPGGEISASPALGATLMVMGGQVNARSGRWGF